VVQGVVLLLSVAFIVINLLTDLVYAYVDPRIRYG
jgi:peptide/nickel transport system permease protein